jgi:hypothetical protein
MSFGDLVQTETVAITSGLPITPEQLGTMHIETPN